MYNYDRYEFTVCIDGKSVKEYNHRDENVYIEGRRGSEFTLKFKNKSSDKVLVVLSVDGLSVMDGKPASDKSGGYICQGYDTIDIPGWRIDDREIAKFKFQPQGDRDNKTYVEELAAEGFAVDPANQGVIGVLVFKQKEREVYTSSYIHHYHHYNEPYWSGNGLYYPTGVRGMDNISCSAKGIASGPISMNASGFAPASSMGAQNFVGMNAITTLASVTPTASLGTGMGDAQDFKTSQVTFDREAVATWTGAIFYDTRSNLQKKGIIFAEERKPTPRAFPAMTNSGCYVPKSHR